MTSEPDIAKENTRFLEKAEKAVADLFQLARNKNELHFAFALNPDFRGIRDRGWSTTVDLHTTFDEYLNYIKEGELTAFRARVALAFYCHLAEASGFYETPKNMMRIAEGKSYVIWPFHDLNQKHAVTGATIAPNANRVFRDLVGHANTIGLSSLAEVFRDAFEPDLRNGYAHADYIVWDDGIRLPMRTGGARRTISWPQFQALLERAINFFLILRNQVVRSMKSFNPPRQILAQLSDEPEALWTIHHDETGFFYIYSHGS